MLGTAMGRKPLQGQLNHKRPPLQQTKAPIKPATHPPPQTMLQRLMRQPPMPLPATPPAVMLPLWPLGPHPRQLLMVKPVTQVTRLQRRLLRATRETSQPVSRRLTRVVREGLQLERQRGTRIPTLLRGVVLMVHSKLLRMLPNLPHPLNHLVRLHPSHK